MGIASIDGKYLGMFFIHIVYIGSPVMTEFGSWKI